MTERLRLLPGVDVVLRAHGDGWLAGPERPDEAPCVAGDGAAEALLRLLGERTALPDGWDLLRLAPAPLAEGERAIEVDQTNRSLVIGEAVVVKWQRRIADRPHSAPALLSQLAATGFEATPPAYSVLTWTSPRGHVLPVAVVTGYLPGARDGWEWCTELVRRRASGDRSDPWVDDLPARLGALTALLHRSLATPTKVFAHPVHHAGAARTRHWQVDALTLLEGALGGSDPEASAILEPRAERIARRFSDALADSAAIADTPVIPVHGDLHVGQILRWSGGQRLAVIDFDGNPVVDADSAAGLLQPAARDVAQLIRSLDHVGQIVLRRSPETDPGAVREWMAGAREELLTAYRAGLEEAGLSSLLDERLLVAFELEQELRELVYAARHLPEWAYAPAGSLRDMLPDDGRPTLWS